MGAPIEALHDYASLSIRAALRTGGARLPALVVTGATGCAARSAFCCAQFRRERHDPVLRIVSTPGPVPLVLQPSTTSVEGRITRRYPTVEPISHIDPHVIAAFEQGGRALADQTVDLLRMRGEWDMLGLHGELEEEVRYLLSAVGGLKGSAEALGDWLRERVPALGGESPLALIKRGDTAEIWNLYHRIVHSMM